MKLDENKQHLCGLLENGKDEITIQTLERKTGWFWIDWENRKAHQIMYCPYCGEKLESEGD